MVRRSKFEIQMGILECCVTPKRVSKIMQQVNLGPGVVYSYTNLLIEKGLLMLLTDIKGSYSRFWKTTTSGLQIVKCWRQLIGMWESAGKKPVTN